MKTFILGLGGQKCGTTSITQLLKKAGVMFPLGNEAHYLDKCFQPRYNQIKYKTKKGKKKKSLIKPWEYAKIFNDYSKTKKFVGDFTPAYCSLSIAELTYAKKILKEEGFNIKTIFIARDPFKRCWSAARMNQGNNFLKEGGSIQEAHEWFKKRMLSKRYQSRTRYEETITNIQKSFSNDEVYIDIFERIFRGNILHNLQPMFEYLELEPPTTQLEVKKSSNLKLAEPTKYKDVFYKHYQNTYNFMHKNFPDTIKLWDIPK
tara:strand:+ start:2632 stop:3414 length:783 start_codon:yes stop_codon:yes gene_type:complete